MYVASLGLSLTARLRFSIRTDVGDVSKVLYDEHVDLAGKATQLTDDSSFRLTTVTDAARSTLMTITYESTNIDH